MSALLLLLILAGCGAKSSSTSHFLNRPDIESLLLIAGQNQSLHPDTALLLARHAHTLSVNEKYEPGIGRSSLLLGNLYYEMGRLSLATKHLKEASNVFEKHQLILELARTESFLGNVYQRSGNYTTAHEYLLKARTRYMELNNLQGMAAMEGELGHYYEKIQRYDSALYFQQRALKSYLTLGDSAGIAQIHDHIGSIYEDLSNYDLALTHFEIAHLLNTTTGNKAAAITNLNNISDCYRKKQAPQTALKYAQKTLQEAERIHLDYQIKSACRDLAKIYEALGQHKSALHYLNRSYELTNKLFTQEIAQEIANTESIYELDQKQQRIHILEKERQFNRLLSLLAAIGAAGFGLLGAFIFYQQRTKNEKKRKLLETANELNAAEVKNFQLKEQKLRADLENQRLQEERLQHELELKSKSLTKSALHMIQKNEFLQEMRQRLKEIRKAPPESIDLKLKKLIKSIDYNFTMDDDWQEFEMVFQQVHSEFFVKLKQLYPNLSPAEVRLCAMIRLNLHSKDMAAIMGISPDSLRIARYRLRKSLGLKKGANLYAFIINIG